MNSRRISLLGSGEQHARRNPSKSGFTLVELLIVLALIALLSAIAFPVLGSARESARSRKCVANLRQIGQAFQLYGQDWDGRFPAALDASDYRSPKLWLSGHGEIEDAYATVTAMRKEGRTLPVVMGNLITSKQVWECPSDIGVKFLNLSRAPSKGDTEDSSVYEAWGSSYAYRTELGLWDRDQADLRDPAAVNVLWDMAGYWHARYRRISREADVQDKAKWNYHVLWGDGHVSNASDDQLYEAWGLFSQSRNPFNH